MDDISPSHSGSPNGAPDLRDIRYPDTNRQILLTARPTEIPQPSDFQFREDAIGTPAPGEFLVRNIYLSVDPAQRGWASDVGNYSSPVPLGTAMRALAVAEVIESRADGVTVGDFLYGWFGWQDYAIASPDAILTRIGSPALPLSAYAGPLGINGLTAYLALGRLGRPSPGETIVVSTAAGAVGSIVGQLAREAGCRTIGVAGGATKCAECVENFGYDAAIDYKADDFTTSLGKALPNGIDIFFDNVGGSILDATLRNMRTNGRVIQCGTASVTRWDETPIGPRVEREILTRRLSWSGFVIFDHSAEYPAAMKALEERVLAGTLHYKEDISNEIEEAPAALQQLYKGLNRGKRLIYIG